ncbi:hypothetical protein V2A60_003780 [Cordyceps javanica]
MRSSLLRLLRRSWYSRVQILSDLHLEVGQQYAAFTFPATAPYLLLAGDVGRLVDYDGYRAFLAAQTARYEAVLLVLGNHEFYGLSRAAGLDAARRLAADPALAPRLVLLHRARWDSPRSRLTVLGCTLWSDVAADRAALVQARVADFRKVTGGWTVAAHCAAHREDAAWLRAQVASLDGDGGDGGGSGSGSGSGGQRRVLVATHHAPCLQGTSLPEHEGGPLASAFATEMLVDGAGWAPVVRTWVFGHTHYSVDMVRGGVRVVANQRGYVFPPNPDAVEGHRPKRTTASGGFDPAKTVVA